MGEKGYMEWAGWVRRSVFPIGLDVGLDIITGVGAGEQVQLRDVGWKEVAGWCVHLADVDLPVHVAAVFFSHPRSTTRARASIPHVPSDLPSSPTSGTTTG